MPDTQQSDHAALPNGNGRAEDQTPQPDPNKPAIPLRTSNPVRRSAAKRATVRATAIVTRRSQRGRAKRGSNALRIEQILKNTRRAVRQADIRNALMKKGVSLPFPSIRYALGQWKRGGRPSRLATATLGVIPPPLETARQ